MTKTVLGDIETTLLQRNRSSQNEAGIVRLGHHVRRNGMRPTSISLATSAPMFGCLFNDHAVELLLDIQLYHKATHHHGT